MDSVRILPACDLAFSKQTTYNDPEMNARTCLLCGKALSRIWVGAGEDFCSREHRNQYRLRKGMDRLHEANKVATLMRRREQPKPITATLQQGNSDTRLPDASLVRFHATDASPALPSSKWSPPARVPGARGAMRTRSSPPEEPRQREYGILRGLFGQKAPRVTLSKGVRKIDPPGANYLERIRRPQTIRVSGRHGNALRVSTSSGFRLPAKRGRHFPGLRHTYAGMRWPDRLIGRNLSSFDRPATATLMRIKIRARDLPCPISSVPILDSMMQWPEAIALARHLADGDRLTGRSWGAMWSRTEAVKPRAIPASPRERAAAPLARLPQKVEYGSASKQIALVPWTAPESPFGYAPAKQNNTADRSTSGNGRSKMEEHFENGFGDWTGGVDDWCVDAAGVRTGSLALFRPSMELHDYDMEFLARIENQSVSWVFRAANLNDYYIASIGTAPGGGYEFWRGTVIGGIQGSIEAVPLRNPPKGKTAVTIRLRAAGKEFSVWVDGQNTDTWSDNRFSSGGIGFIGASNDRARIYWLKLSPVGGTGKE